MVKAHDELKTGLAIQKKVDEALIEQKNRLEAEHARILKILDSDERDSELLNLQITNEILNLRCPNCKTAFHDFEGIFYSYSTFQLFN